MARILKIVALAIGLAALGFLVFFGLALWVFIPLLPAGIVYVVAVYFARRAEAVRTHAAETEHRKAA